MKKLKFSKKTVIVLNVTGVALIVVVAYFVSSTGFSFDFRRRAVTEDDIGVRTQALRNGENPSLEIVVDDKNITNVKFVLYRDGAMPHGVDCIKRGETGVSVDGDECCAGLDSVSNSFLEDGVCIAPNDGSFVCTECGDGECEKWENECNCLEDCPEACVEEGKGTTVTPDALSCCEGLTSINCDELDEDGVCTQDCVGFIYCTQCGDGKCRRPENECNCPEDCPKDCIKEGKSGSGVNGDECCSDLTKISNAVPADVEGGCIVPTNGGFMCTKCGDGHCGKGENWCNCPEDCDVEVEVKGNVGIRNLTAGVLAADVDDDLVSEIVVPVDGGTSSTWFNLFEIYSEALGSGITLENIKKEVYGHSYRVWACGCVTDRKDECNCVTGYVKTDDYDIISPDDIPADIEVDGAGICNSESKNTNIDVSHKTRTWFKLQVSESAARDGNDVQTHYVNNEYPASSVFTMESGHTYSIVAYVCHAISSYSETLGMDMCETTPIGTKTYTAPDCISDEVDLGTWVSLTSGTKIPYGRTVELTANLRKIAGPIRIPNVFNVVLGTDPDCLECDPIDSKRYEHEFAETAVTPDIRHYDYEYDDLEVGVYYFGTEVETRDHVDFNPDNDVALGSFEVYDTGDCGDIECGDREVLNINTCECVAVECTTDEHCVSGDQLARVCDQSRNRCVCDETQCDAGKEMNQDCTACICSNTCLLSQVQYPLTCECFDVCTTVCNPWDREILTAECECRTVECIYDAHCSGLEYCSRDDYSCRCPSCGAGLVANSSCTACVCGNTCSAGQIQRSDCSCYTPVSTGCTNTCAAGQIRLDDCSCYTLSQTEGQDGQTTQETEDNNILDDSNVKIKIEYPEEGQSLKIGSKVLFRYELEGDGDVDTDKVEWFVGETSAGAGNFVSYVFEDQGDYKVEVKYKGETQDTSKVRVLDEQAQSDTVEDKAEKTEGIGVIWYFVIGIGVVLLLGAAVLLFGPKV